MDLPSVGSLRSGPNGTIELFREDTVLVRERSRDLFWEPGSAAEPKGILGEVPDRLVPLTGALDIEAGGFRVIWVDLWIPVDTVAGHHQGMLVVRSPGTCEAGCEIEVKLEVLDLSMPDVVRSKTMLWFSAGEPEPEYVDNRYFEDPSSESEQTKRALRLRHYHLARKHRITLFWEYHTPDSPELDSLLSGEAFSAGAGYPGPGQGLGQDILVVRSYTGTIDAKLAATWNEFSKRYPKLLDTFVYTMDEPPKSEYAEVNRRAAASRPHISTFVTAYSEELDVEIFAVPSGVYSRVDARRVQETGRKMWVYNGSRPFSGSFAIDDVAISTRVNPWIQYKADIERWFYWDSTYYYDFQGERGAIDIGREAGNFSNKDGDLLNGDGLLMYPGRDLLFPDSDLGLDGPVASIRLKNWRRGIEDVEYLVMARAAGFDREVDALLETLLPRTLNETSESSAVSWPEDGRRWQLARRYLFELLRDGESSIVLSDIARPKSADRPEERMKLYIFALGALFALLAAFLYQYYRRVRG
ncbi:MAG: DUF4091 domain-containing protein [Kofleriaceae bacterium]|nr:DUF4091 domain-containing protein [Kofleriaceae bacterium]